jgi:hypothetical protein
MGGGATNNKARQAASAAWHMGVSASNRQTASVAGDRTINRRGGRRRRKRQANRHAGWRRKRAKGVALERHRENTAHTINISRAKRNRGGCCKSGGCGNNGDGASYGAGDMSRHIKHRVGAYQYGAPFRVIDETETGMVKSRASAVCSMSDRRRVGIGGGIARIRPGGGVRSGVNGRVGATTVRREQYRHHAARGGVRRGVDGIDVGIVFITSDMGIANQTSSRHRASSRGDGAESGIMARRIFGASGKSNA